MKQIIQSLRNGKTEVKDIPIPNVSSKSILIKSSISLISTGTEKMLVDFGKANWVQKAIKQPDKVKFIINKMKAEGVQSTIDKVFKKLDKPIPLGYCNVGKVIEIGNGVKNFSIGDRVVSNGKHAEVVNVPINLAAKVPNIVSDEEASFAVLGAVALQGIRLTKPTLGEAVVVMGLGLVGLITVQLLKANGCRVLGVDLDPERLLLAKEFGAEVLDINKQNLLLEAHNFSRGIGIDATIITASTDSDDLINDAAKISRKRARIVLVGVSGLKLSREEFYKKEITFQVSSSYGPGRYDPNYEEKGQDYPVGFVRWTEQRNLEAVLDMMEAGLLKVKKLISHRFDISEAEKSYNLLLGQNPSLGILLTYPNIEISNHSKKVLINENTFFSNFKTKKNNKAILDFIGAGNYASSVLIPAFKDADVELSKIASQNGLNGTYLGQKYGFKESTTDLESIFNDQFSNTLVIATRHDTHADLVIKALKANKHVFVEKPLCLTIDELNEIKKVYSSSKNILMVGFNRRFAPQIIKIKNLLNNINTKKAFVMTVNAGKVDLDHWTQDMEIGGGRLIGEACHFIDLIRFIVGKPVKNYSINKMETSTRDTFTINLDFDDGSIASIHYFANGSNSFPKERLEIFSSGGILQLDNFHELRGYCWPGFKKMKLWKQDKGNKACSKAFIDSILNGNKLPIPIEEIFEVSKIAIELSNQ